MRPFLSGTLSPLSSPAPATSRASASSSTAAASPAALTPTHTFSGHWAMASSPQLPRPPHPTYPFSYEVHHSASSNTLHLTGHFSVQSSNPLELESVPETDVVITLPAPQTSRNRIAGKGSNRFGHFTLSGRKLDDVISMFREYNVVLPSPAAVPPSPSGSLKRAPAVGLPAAPGSTGGKKPVTPSALLARLLDLDATRYNLFSEPVDAQALGLRNYHRIVTRPMDLGTIQARVHASPEYSSSSQAVADMRLVFDNALLFNPRGTPVYRAAQEMLAVVDGAFTPPDVTTLGKRPRAPKVVFEPAVQMSVLASLSPRQHASHQQASPRPKKKRLAAKRPGHSARELLQLQSQVNEMSRKLEEAAAAAAAQFPLDLLDEFEEQGIDSDLDDMIGDEVADDGQVYAAMIGGVETPPRRSALAFESPAIRATASTGGGMAEGSPFLLLTQSPSVLPDNLLE